MGRGREGEEEDVLIMLMVSALQARLSGSLRATSAVRKMPWTEHCLTLNWRLQKHSRLEMLAYGLNVTLELHYVRTRARYGESVDSTYRSSGEKFQSVTAP